MKRRFKKVLLTVLCFLALTYAQGQVSWLHVDGNQIEDEAGNPVTLRGVSVIAPEHNNECTTCSLKPVSELIDLQMDASQGWHSRVLRLQITTAKVSDPAKSFATIIDPYVQLAVAKGIYVIVDLHYVSNFDYNGSGGVAQSQVQEFWSYVAPRYANIPNVIFEVFNEPIAPDCWSCWKEYIQPVVNTIRAAAPNNLILMGSPQWSTRLNGAVSDPILGNDIVYVYHLYPNQGQATATNLDPKFGTASQSVPVMITEFGWNQDPNYSDAVTQGSTSGWGAPLREYLDARPHISWTSFIFDNYWKPQFFDSNWVLMSGGNQGQFMQQWLAETKDDSQPQPSALRAFAANSSQINLSWPAVAGSDSYIVKQATISGGPYTPIASELTGTTYSVTGLNPQSTYYYVVVPVTGGMEGPVSPEADAITPSPGYAPDVPSDFSATAGNGQVSLTWGASAGASTYTVKRSLSPGGPYTEIASGISTTVYTDTDVTNGIPYFYVVSAVGGKESVNSSESGDIPSSVVVIADNQAAALTGTWTASSATPGFLGADYLHDGNTGSTGGKAATYAPNLPASGAYFVAVRWTSASNRASNVSVDVSHAGGTTNFIINQRHDGGQWISLGAFNFNSGTSGNVVIRNDGANGFVVADAVKFALSAQGSVNNPPTASYTHAMAGLTVDFDASESFDTDGTIVSYEWDFGDGNTGSGQTVSHTYAADGNYSVTLTVRDNEDATDAEQQSLQITQGGGSGNVTTVTVDQRSGAGVMNVIGTFTFDAGTGGSVKVRTGGTNGYVVADAVKFSRPGEADIVLDNSSVSGVSIEGAWSASSSSPGYVGTNYLHDGNSAKGTKSVTYTPDLPVAGEWTVAVQWTSDPNRATNVPIDVTHAGTGPVLSLHVESITEGTQSASQGNKAGTARIVIFDSFGNPRSNATVTGTFSGDFNETTSGVTGSDGSVTLVTAASKKGTLNFDFCVDDVTHASLDYNPGFNVVTCSGTSSANFVQTDSQLNEADSETADLYPNPAETSFVLDVSAFSGRPIYLRIINSHGTTLVAQKLTGDDPHEVSVHGWNPGLYIIRLSAEGKLVTRKLFIK